MVGHKLGEFALTRIFKSHSAAGKRTEEAVGGDRRGRGQPAAAAPGAPPGGPRRSPPTASSVRLPTAEWLLKMRVSANSPSLWPTMFSVTYTGMCCLPLCTAIVRPTKSGMIVERRDQVLIGRLSLPSRALSTFAMQVVVHEGTLLD